MSDTKEVLLKLHRNYSRNELNDLASQIVAKQEIEIGVLKSTIAELEYKLEEVKAYSNDIKAYKKAYKQSITDEHVANLNREVKALRDSNSKLKIENEKLFSMLAKLNLQLKQM